MTDFSLRIERWPAEADQQTLEAASGLGETVRSLRFAARDWGPYGLAAWAKAREIPLFYVDSCWVRAAVTDEQAREFLKALPDDQPLDAAGDNWRYVIEAEEF